MPTLSSFIAERADTVIVVVVVIVDVARRRHAKEKYNAQPVWFTVAPWFARQSTYT